MSERHALPVAALAALVLTAVGCGKAGPPLAPLPRGPLPPAKVTAREVGPRVIVRFEVPRARGDRPAQRPVLAELVRLTYAPGVQPPSDPDAFRRGGVVVGQQALQAGAGEIVSLEDLRLVGLPEGGAGCTLRYAIRVRDRRGRPSALVVAPDLVPLPGGSPPTALEGEVTAQGVRLTWRPAASAEPPRFNVYRAAAGAPWPELPLNAEPLAAAEYLDGDVEPGAEYAYSVRASLADGRPMREGPASPTWSVVAEDRFPPGAPSGLLGVIEGRAVRLFWNPNPERDLAGYLVRRSVDGVTWQLLTPRVLDQTSFLDEDPPAGGRAAYRVFAIDRGPRANESPASEIVEVDLDDAPDAGAGGAP